MTSRLEHPTILHKLGEHEYLAYEVTDHAEHPPTSIVVRVERHGDPKHAVFCTGSFVDGKLTRVYARTPEQAETPEERAMIGLFNASPDLQSFVRDWIQYAYDSYEKA